MTKLPISAFLRITRTSRGPSLVSQTARAVSSSSCWGSNPTLVRPGRDFPGLRFCSNKRTFCAKPVASTTMVGADADIAEVMGNVHSYESMSHVDGPGMRYIVFLQGCTKRCVFCANPDTISSDGGTLTSSKEVARKLARAAPYLKKGSVRGGVTMSGGEPSIQPEFVSAVFQEAQALGLTTCIDTSGAGTMSGWNEFLPYTDYALVCIKSMDNARYNWITQTNESRRVVLRFVEELDKRGITFWIRHVLLPGHTDTEKELTKLAELAASHSHCQGIELLPYHRLGLHKYQELGIRYPLGDLEPPTHKATAAAKAILEGGGVSVLL